MRWWCSPPGSRKWDLKVRGSRPSCWRPAAEAACGWSAAGVRLNATFAPVSPRPGRIGFASQSGAFGIAAIAEATRRGLGLSSFASTGDKADLSGNDFLRFW